MPIRRSENGAKINLENQLILELVVGRFVAEETRDSIRADLGSLERALHIRGIALDGGKLGKHHCRRLLRSSS